MIAKNSSQQNIGERIDNINSRIISDINENIRNNTDILLREDIIKRKIRKLIHFGKLSFKNGVKKENLERFLWFINDLFTTFPISKVYYLNGINTNTEEYEKLPLEEMFLHNIMIKNENHSSFSVTQGGSCVHWVIFFYYLFNNIGLGDDKYIQRNFVTFDYNKPGIDHIGFLIRYQGTVLLIDPFTLSESGGIVHLIKTGKSISKGEGYKQIISDNPIKIEGDDYIREFSYKEKLNFLKKSNFRYFSTIGSKHYKFSILYLKNSFIFKLDNTILAIVSFIDIKENIDSSRTSNSFDLILDLIGYGVLRGDINTIKYIAEKIPIKDLINFFKLHLSYPPSAEQ